MTVKSKIAQMYNTSQMQYSKLHVDKWFLNCSDFIQIVSFRKTEIIFSLPDVFTSG